MSIQYAGGTIVNTTFVSDGTRGNLISNLNTQLKNAGWTIVSGDGTGDVLVQSATTPAGLFIRFRLYDPGANNCAQITMKNNGTPAALTSSIAYVLPTNGKTFRIIANKYQFFMFSSGATYRKTNREIVMGGVPYMWDFNVAVLLSDFQCGWFVYNGESDTDVAAKSTWRDCLSFYTSSNKTASSLLMNNMLNYTTYNHASPAISLPMFIEVYSNYGYRLLDNSTTINEAIIGWASGIANNTEIKFIGMLWDALVHGAVAAGESTISFDGRTYMAITDQSVFHDATLYIAVT